MASILTFEPRDTTPPPKKHRTSSQTNCTPTKRRLLTYMRDEQHKSFREIARFLHMDHKTVSENYRDMKRTGDPYKHQKKSSGRPRRIPGAVMEDMINSIDLGKVRHGEHAKLVHCPEVPSRTVRRALAKEGLNGRKRRKKPKLSIGNTVGRRDWAQEMSDLDADDWRCVIFSDESKFNLFGSDGVQYCRRRKGEALEERNLLFTVPHGGGSVMVWGCITEFGPGRLVRVTERMTGTKYTEILTDGLFGTLDDHNIPHDLDTFYVFQQDNDPKHTSKVAQKWFKKHKLRVLPWPSRSPDMNIIENVWWYLETRIRSRSPLPNSVEQLWIALQEEWKRIPLDYINKLFDSLPTRINDVLAADGGSTRY